MIFPCPYCKKPTKELRFGVVFWCEQCQKELMITEINRGQLDKKEKN